MLILFLNTSRVDSEHKEFWKRKIQKILKIYKSRFVNIEIPPEIYEMIDLNKTINEIVNIT